MTHYLVRVGLVFGIGLPTVLFASILVAQGVERGIIVFFMVWAAAAVGARIPDGFFEPTGDAGEGDT